MADNIFVSSLESSEGKSIAIALFTDVTNAKELRKNVISGKFEAALLKPAMITDPFQVIVATHKAVHSQKHSRMKTKTLHSEILFDLSPTNSIKDAFSKFGISDHDTSMLVATVTSEDAQEKMNSISQYVEGKQVPLSELCSLTNENNIKQLYKIQQAEVGSLLEAVVCRIAIKDCL